MRAVALPSSEEPFNEKEGERAASHPSSQMTGFQSPSTKFHNFEVGLLRFFLATIFSLLCLHRSWYLFFVGLGVFGDLEMLPECEWLRAERKAGLHAALHTNATMLLHTQPALAP